MDLERLLTTAKVAIVAGKGGVGKTTVVATLATAAARAGMSVLVVEVEGKSGLAEMFGTGPLAYEEREVSPGITIRTMTPDEALHDYLNDHSLRRISQRLLRSGASEIVATAVPGMREILVLGKIKQLEVEGRFDLILVDAPAAGHAVAFILSPRGLLDAVSVGPIRKQAVDVIEMLTDPTRCQVVLVTLPEETPVSELIDTAYVIEDRGGVALGPVVVNGCVPAPDFEPNIGAAAIRDLADDAGVALSNEEIDDLARAAAFRRERYSLQREQVARLHDRLPLPQIELPALDVDTIDAPAIADLVDALHRASDSRPEPT